MLHAGRLILPVPLQHLPECLAARPLVLVVNPRCHTQAVGVIVYLGKKLKFAVIPQIGRCEIDIGHHPAVAGAQKAVDRRRAGESVGQPTHPQAQGGGCVGFAAPYCAVIRRRLRLRFGFCSDCVREMHEGRGIRRVVIQTVRADLIKRV